MTCYRREVPLQLSQAPARMEPAAVETNRKKPHAPKGQQGNGPGSHSRKVIDRLLGSWFSQHIGIGGMKRSGGSATPASAV